MVYIQHIPQIWIRLALGYTLCVPPLGQPWTNVRCCLDWFLQYWSISFVDFRVAPLAPRQSYDFPRAHEASQNGIGKPHLWTDNKTTTNPTLFFFRYFSSNASSRVRIWAASAGSVPASNIPRACSSIGPDPVPWIRAANWPANSRGSAFSPSRASCNVSRTICNSGSPENITQASLRSWSTALKTRIVDQIWTWIPGKLGKDLAQSANQNAFFVTRSYSIYDYVPSQDIQISEFGPNRKERCVNSLLEYTHLPNQIKIIERDIATTVPRIYREHCSQNNPHSLYGYHN